MHADVDVPISQRTKLELTYKNDTEEGQDVRADVSQSQDFDNYDPRRRREEIEAARLTATPSPTPSRAAPPSVSPTAIPENP